MLRERDVSGYQIEWGPESGQAASPANRRRRPEGFLEAQARIIASSCLVRDWSKGGISGTSRINCLKLPEAQLSVWRRLACASQDPATPLRSRHNATWKAAAI